MGKVGTEMPDTEGVEWGKEEGSLSPGSLHSRGGKTDATSGRKGVLVGERQAGLLLTGSMLAFHHCDKTPEIFTL